MLRMQLKVRASVISFKTKVLFLSLSSRKMQTTFDSFCFTHFDRLCFFTSERIDPVSPMQDAAWLARPALSTLRREKMKTAGDSGMSAANG